MQKQLSEGLFKKSVMINFAEFTRKRLCRNLIFEKVKLCRSLQTRLQPRCFVVNFAKFIRKPFLQNTTRRLLLIIAVSIVLVMKGELANETVNYDTKTIYQFEPELSLSKKDTPDERTGYRRSRLQTSVFKTFVNSTGNHLRLRLLAWNSTKKRCQYR